MNITKEMLKEKGACADGYLDFIQAYPPEKYPNGIDYQTLLDRCADENPRYGHWLLRAFGPTDTVREIYGDLDARRSIIFAGTLKVSGCIVAGWNILAGRDIKAGRDIVAGCNIVAGGNIEANWYIKAGELIAAGCNIVAGRSITAGCNIVACELIVAGKDYGIYAGHNAPITSKNDKIFAKNKPDNIMCGTFVQI